MIFEKLIGNDKIKEELADTIKSNNVSHSYLFAGPEGIGKKLFAREFANVDTETLDKIKKLLRNTEE